ncbi:LysR family transcriptional regulator [Pigmentiphaga litoralis]|uniref:DNA-binding transcriptional LysR family regulator n=1 Tax=Pigmentiphaga litoralis TaxID=516702 RepID=A0A7Y9IYT7_9BURK|nr:LysR family transcriptional regulator [Pigmentiphaga litoralis]NYE26371.1 DNA-binding transcriptional LysR family regulator [Pigmentiphaga litoralis]NYE85491.1 DNA-binding transcriptional LysR family regulator [Pigmentiphaga litoralis]
MAKHLDVRHLKAVLATAEAGSLHRAAAILHTSQPALSRLLREAEERLGQVLFERTAKGSRVTAAGALVEQVARRVTSDIARLGDLTDKAAWKLRVGCIPRALGSVMPRLLHAPPELLGNVEIDLQEDDSPTLSALLQRGALDIAILTPPAEHLPDILYRRFYMDRNVFVSGRTKALGHDHPLTVDDLARHPFVAPAAGTPSRAEFDHYWLQHAVQPPVCRMAARTYDAIASVLPGTQLLSVMPQQVAQRHVRGGTLRILEVAIPLPERPIHIAWSVHALQPITDQVIERLLPLRRDDNGPKR